MTLVWLQRAYLRRVQFEARVLAGEVGRMLSGESDQRSAVSGQPEALQPGQVRRGNDGKVYRVVDAQALMMQAGARL